MHVAVFSVCCFGFGFTENERFEHNLFVPDSFEISFGSNFGCFEGHPTFDATVCKQCDAFNFAGRTH